MWSALPLILLSFTTLNATARLSAPSAGTPAGPIPGLTCLSHPPTATKEAGCAQFAVSAKLRPQPPSLPVEPVARSGGGAGKGALVGLGVGLGLGTVAALVVAQGCEENQSRCSVGMVVGGAALGAGIGAVVGAVVGRD